MVLTIHKELLKMNTLWQVKTEKANVVKQETLKFLIPYTVIREIFKVKKFLWVAITNKN